MMDQQLRKEYGDDLDGLVPPSGGSASGGRGNLEVDGDDHTASAASKSLLFYVATVQAFVIIYRTEVLLGCSLAICLGIAVSSSTHTRRRKSNPFQAAHISEALTSQYDLSLGSIDHWCLRGDDNSCRCEDPLEPMSKRSSSKWSEQHAENIKVAQAAVLKVLAAAPDWDGYSPYGADFDDGWVDGTDDDWVYGAGERFGLDDFGDYSFEDADDWAYDGADNFADPEPTGTDDDPEPMGRQFDDDDDDINEDDNDIWHRRLIESDHELDVVFLGDAMTEQRQGTSMGKPVIDFAGMKEVFEKTFTKDKGGDFNGIAMGIAGDTSNNLLWRLMNGEMPWNLNPKVWWVSIGINDLSMKGCSEEVVLLGILRVVEEIQKEHDGIVVINSLLPVQRNAEGLLEHLGKHHEDVALKKKDKDMADGDMSEKRDHHDLWPSVVAINGGLRKFASKTKGVKMFDADGVFVEERQGGKYLKLDLMLDPVHPNLSGHKKWNSAVKKRLHELIKE